MKKINPSKALYEWGYFLEDAEGLKDEMMRIELEEMYDSYFKHSKGNELEKIFSENNNYLYK